MSGQVRERNDKSSSGVNQAELELHLCRNIERMVAEIADKQRIKKKFK